MSGDNFDQALFDAYTLPWPDNDVTAADRTREIYAEHGNEVAAWIVAGTDAAFDRSVQIQRRRLDLVAALDAIDQATADATTALDALDHMGDMVMITPQRRGVGTRFALIDQSLSQVRIGAASARSAAPDPDAPEEN